MAKSSGVRNILALRGDPPHPKKSWNEGDVSGGECDRAIDLVKFIRKLHGDYFGIGVAGHPEGHPSSNIGDDGTLEMKHLKEKVDAGADFIITQFFYDVDVFLEYVKKCRRIGIKCPIIPGIMPIQSYSSLLKMTQFCAISVPSAVIERLERVRHDDEAVKKIGCEIASEMCHRILTETSASLGHNNDDDCRVHGFHFYTLNLERSTTRILASLGALDFLDNPNQSSADAEAATAADTEAKTAYETNGEDQIVTRRERQESISEKARSSRRVLPWKPSAMENRSKEDVRPINWSNRPKSYVMRTDDWDEFPNGRWGDSTSPAFGELSDLSHFYSFTLGCNDDRRAMLGHCPLNESDVYEVFAQYVEGKVPHIPWCETPLQPESFLIQPQLARLNRFGFLTVNSQPPVDGAPSNHPTFGWGGKGGRVYQRGYFECFVSPEKTNRLTSMVTKHPSMIMYAVNNAGQELRVGVEEGGVTALTWGVFPNREILQPTIFDPGTFLVWAEEAFSLWSSMWLSLYDFGSESYQLIENIKDSFYLVAIIDNDYYTNEGFVLLDALLEEGEKCSYTRL
jgi:methylenetetrahydrofolate reductase (NADPH)